MTQDSNAALTRRGWLCQGLQLAGTACGLAVAHPARAQAAPGVTANQVVIGQNISLEGGKNDYGVAVRQGVDAALRQVNSQGGVNGRQLVVKVMDDGAKAATAEANARQLVAEGVFLLFGSIEGGPSNAVMKAAIETQVPFFGPMAGSPTFRRPHQPLVFPVRAEHREEFRALLAHGFSLGMRRVAFQQSDSEVGRLHLANVRLAAEALKLPEVLPLVIGGEVKDAQLDDFVRQLGAQRIELVINHGSSGVYERLIRKARSAGLGTVFYGVNSGSAQLAAHLGQMAHGMVFTQVVPSPWERKSALTRDYQDALHIAFPGAAFSYGSLEGYVTLRALAEALRRAGRELSRPGLLRALGDVQFDISGFKLRYHGNEHVGSTFVDTAMVTREGRFVH
jgi:branched-chain amino acid transport system substrate-binding protein